MSANYNLCNKKIGNKGNKEIEGSFDIDQDFNIRTFYLSRNGKNGQEGEKISEFVFVLLRPSFNYQIMGMLSMFLSFGKMTKFDSQKRNI